MVEDEFKKEEQKLKEIIAKYKEVIEYYDLKLEALPRLYKKDPVTLESLLETYGKKYLLLQRSIKKPYFARIDFKDDKETEKEELYIGKVGVLDKNSKNIVIDWRAPISSIYYDSNIGRAKYMSPSGERNGELLVKRQYDIEEGELISYQDVDTVSNDELLKPYLNASADKRLKNIVSTIQSEQNNIIREKLSKNLIIQGVAGSGKTTVALHRIAYLVYNNINTIKPEQYLVIGPNKFFVDYISGILPDLDVENVSQLTYMELCENFLDEQFEEANEEEKLVTSINNIEKLKYEQLKVSMKYKEYLDKYISNLEQHVMDGKTFAVKGYEIISNKQIKDTYESIENSIVYNTIQKKVDRTALLLTKYIEDNRDQIKEKIEKQYEYLKDKSKYDYVIKALNTGFTQDIKKYFSKIIPKTIDLYIDFLIKLSKYCDEEFENKIIENIKNIKKRIVEFEDYSALIYLKAKVIGTDKYSNYLQVVIDEAQDYGEFTFYAIKELLNKVSFSIFGDLAQSIYEYRGIKHWEDVKKLLFEDDCELMYLEKSYRTTAEIMNEANRINRKIGLKEALPVIRHGEDVEYIRFLDEAEQLNRIINNIRDYKNKGFNSIAVICKDEKEAVDIYNKLKENNIELSNIIASDSKYLGGICTITNYLAKGLEFDGVIISDASKEKYKIDKTIDMKLLYVSMTRPLHELKVLYKNEINEALVK